MLHSAIYIKAIATSARVTVGEPHLSTCRCAVTHPRGAYIAAGELQVALEAASSSRCCAGGADGFLQRAAAGSWDAEVLQAGHMDFLDWGPQGASGEFA